MYLDGASTRLLIISKSKLDKLFGLSFGSECAKCVEN